MRRGLAIAASLKQTHIAVQDLALYPVTLYPAVLSEHRLYRSLGTSPEERQAPYRGLFAGELDEMKLKVIRDGPQKGEVIGNDRFRAQIGQARRRQVSRLSHGGDRNSEAFKQQQKPPM